MGDLSDREVKLRKLDFLIGVMERIDSKAIKKDMVIPSNSIFAIDIDGEYHMLPQCRVAYSQKLPTCCNGVHVYVQ